MIREETTGFPRQQEALGLYARLQRGDVTASAELAQAYLEPLARSLLRSNPRADQDDCWTAAEDALLSLIKRPASYDPERLTLDAYLRMAARRDLQNLQRAAYRHSSRRADWGAVELSPSQREHITDHESDPQSIVEMNETIEELARQRQALPDSVTRDLSGGERAALQLMQERERRTAAYVYALGLGRLSPSEQRREVKRVKDRLKVRIKRGIHD